MKLSFSQVDAKTFNPVEVEEWQGRILRPAQTDYIRQLNIVYLQKLDELQRSMQKIVDDPTVLERTLKRRGLTSTEAIDQAFALVDHLYYT